jgi:hypothetical protein
MRRHRDISALATISPARSRVEAAVRLQKQAETDLLQYRVSRSIVPVSADRGDSSQTLTVGTDSQIQRWATALTANRTVTLSTTGATNGDWFRVVRTGLGAFTLDVGGLKTIPNATAAAVDVAYDGTAWRLTDYGLL